MINQLLELGQKLKNYLKKKITIKYLWAELLAFLKRDRVDRERLIEVYAQTFIVKGKISTSTEPVRYASIKFVDISDITKKFSVITDSSGNYTLDIVADVKRNKTVQSVKFELNQNYPNPFNPSVVKIELNFVCNGKL